jgi:hypothetical protein
VLSSKSLSPSHNDLKVVNFFHPDFSTSTRRAASLGWEKGLMQNMPSFIPKPQTTDSNSASSHLLPPFLRINSKITFDHEGQYHKGYLIKSPNEVYNFSYKSHVNKKKPDWSASLPNLPTTWQDLCAEGILYPGHSLSSLLWNTLSLSGDPSSPLLNFVSATTLLREYPRSLLTTLAPTHPDRET